MFGRGNCVQNTVSLFLSNFLLNLRRKYFGGPRKKTLESYYFFFSSSLLTKHSLKMLSLDFFLLNFPSSLKSLQTNISWFRAKKNWLPCLGFTFLHILWVINYAFPSNIFVYIPHFYPIRDMLLINTLFFFFFLMQIQQLLENMVPCGRTCIMPCGRA